MAPVTVKQQLDVGDFLRFCDILAEVLNALDADTLREMQQGGGADQWRIGKEIVEQALRVAPKAGERFVAGLVGLDPETFRTYPATAVLDVIEQFSDHEDAADFFGRARSLFNRKMGATESSETPAPEKSSGPSAVTG